MWKRRRTWILLAALMGVALAVYFEPSHCVRGWLWGEAFFDGRPTSYWRGVIERDLQIDPDVLLGRKPPPLPTWWERSKHWIGYRPQADSSRCLVENYREADAVLQELARDEDARIAGFASDAQLVLPDSRAWHWMVFIEKYNIRHPVLQEKHK